jgi:3-oxoacyl-[acyl-carrier protein] reductase
MFTSIAGRTAIVTGSSRGIGRGIALRLGEVGCNVLIISRSLEAAEGVANEIMATGGRASAATIDISDPSQAPLMAEIAITSLARSTFYVPTQASFQLRSWIG